MFAVSIPTCKVQRGKSLTPPGFKSGSFIVHAITLTRVFWYYKKDLCKFPLVISFLIAPHARKKIWNTYYNNIMGTYNTISNKNSYKKKICWNKKWKKFNVPLNLKITSPPVVHLSLTLHPTYLYSLSIPLYISFPPFLFLSLPFSPPYTVKVLTLQIRVLIMLPFRVCKRNSHKANMIIDWRRRGIKHRRRKKKRLFVSKKDT